MYDPQPLPRNSQLHSSLGRSRPPNGGLFSKLVAHDDAHRSLNSQLQTKNPNLIVTSISSPVLPYRDTVRKEEEDKNDSHGPVKTSMWKNCFHTNGAQQSASKIDFVSGSAVDLLNGRNDQAVAEGQHAEMPHVGPPAQKSRSSLLRNFHFPRLAFRSGNKEAQIKLGAEIHETGEDGRPLSRKNVSSMLDDGADQHKIFRRTSVRQSANVSGLRTKSRSTDNPKDRSGLPADDLDLGLPDAPADLALARNDPSRMHYSNGFTQLTQPVVSGIARDPKIHQRFADIRSRWAKTTRTLEASKWTLGNKQEHEKRVEKVFIEAQAEQSYCDVVITTTDHHTLYAHSLVLATHSKAFEKRLLEMNPGTGLPAVYSLNLTDKVTGPDVAKSIEWMYRGHCRIASDRLMDLSKTARFFNMVPLMVECLRRKAATDLAYHKRARRHIDKQIPYEPIPPDPADDEPESDHSGTSHSVSQTGTHRVNGEGNDENGNQDNREAISADHESQRVNTAAQISPERVDEQSERAPSHNEENNGPDNNKSVESIRTVASLTAEQLCEILSDDNLQIQSELEVLDAVMSWIDCAATQRQMYTHQLLNCVRFYYVSDAELKQCFKQHSSYFKSPALRNVIGDAFRARALLQAGQPIPAQFVVRPNRCQNKMHVV